MLRIRKADERGFTKNDWLKSYHTFSFANYYDSNQMNFGNLRVINEDFIAPDSGFSTHSHQDMEIFTYVVSGELSHKDSVGNVESILPGQIQLMSAGSGISHSEFNSLKDQEAHILQIWIFPNQKSLSPSYETKDFNNILKENDITLVASIDGGDDLLKINQEVEIYVGKFAKKQDFEYFIKPNHKVWLQLIKGEALLNDNMTVEAGDGVGVHKEESLKLDFSLDAEFLLFDFG